MEETVLTLSELITALMSVVTQLFNSVGDVFDAAMANPLLQISLGIFFAGAVVGIARRIINIV